MDPGPAAILDAAHATASFVPESAAFDAAEFDGLSDMIGADGVMEMVEIFETETRQRLRRLAAGGQNFPTQMREMHTLKGAAGTVAAPRLTALARLFEQEATHGNAATQEAIEALASALEAYLTEMRAWTGRHAKAA